MKHLLDARRLGRAMLAACCSAGLASFALAQDAPAPNACGSLQNPYGPYDYRTQRENLKIVEGVHFTPHIEQLINVTSLTLGDIDYTLRASPNHHRALMTLARYSEKTKTVTLGPNYSVDCYFDRAMRFASDDPVVRMIYAGHLGRINREREAMVQLDYVARTATDNPFTHSNLGLLYLEIKQYDKALAQAHIAIRLGLQRTELRDALKRAGKWVEPQAAAPKEAASAPAAPGS